MNLNGCLQGCSPAQIVNISEAVNDVPSIKILNACGEAYDNDSLEFAYSIDGACWTCFGTYNEVMSNAADLESDYYVKVKVNGQVSGVEVDDEPADYTTQIAEGFTFVDCNGNAISSNTYNPYANMEQAIALNQNLTETVSCLVGIQSYYFKLAPNSDSVDVTFKEYTLMNVDSVKQIKIIINENQMPSSKPEFSDWGLDFSSDWEVDISKGMFATAFGPTVQPQEGDLIYIPMMKRMWMVNEAYEEKKDAFMWNATTFKVTLVKYQEKGSVDLGDSQALVDSFVKNKYEDLFGNDENVDSSEAFVESPSYAASTYYPVYESDAMRKYVTCKDTEIKSVSRYQKGTLVSDSYYDFTMVPANQESIIVYQHQFCGDDGTASFIIEPKFYEDEFTIFKAANLYLNIKQDAEITDCCTKSKLYLASDESIQVMLKNDRTYFVYLRWSKSLNVVELSAAEYAYPKSMPIYKVQPHNYSFEIDDAETCIGKYNEEMPQYTKGDVLISKLYGNMTNIKLFDAYIDNISEILMMLPTNKHLLINDTARKLIDMNGVSLL